MAVRMFAAIDVGSFALELGIYEISDKTGIRNVEHIRHVIALGSDTFSEGFYYDSIRSTAWIKDGVMHTDDTLVDGLEADIAMKGSVNLVRRELDMEAVVAPEISASVGVAAAFVVNPIVGAAVFAASKVLGPLWSKVSILRYRITGPVDKPQINEVLRQPRKEAPQ